MATIVQLMTVGGNLCSLQQRYFVDTLLARSGRPCNYYSPLPGGSTLEDTLKPELTTSVIVTKHLFSFSSHIGEKTNLEHHPD